ncbi:hypothetical protein VOLCADRAFT_103911 [Volvox carteri f. nagariensis]|uniref:Uncharacterized protein n=1 Tax=Volvox carteri f. nagariensis TaxID=3068 RepID=D8TQ17_VOLCA|nr:uncharacterized protein VOLCADRAFT_103911 [Volvox carteri f. nagariensis]EFJ50324.1 hypothetical protein VOLCADRAFT_103911 [Volvox carteri f. nagariensis]|eukprot:XP_002948449.1 hypothetical protein VOLCADRAFT_103911 [Volvox carteri f. nagariensis]
MQLPPTEKRAPPSPQPQPQQIQIQQTQIQPQQIQTQIQPQQIQTQIQPQQIQIQSQPEQIQTQPQPQQIQTQIQSPFLQQLQAGNGGKQKLPSTSEAPPPSHGGGSRVFTLQRKDHILKISTKILRTCFPNILTAASAMAEATGTTATTAEAAEAAGVEVKKKPQPVTVLAPMAPGSRSPLRPWEAQLRQRRNGGWVLDGLGQAMDVMGVPVGGVVGLARLPNGGVMLQEVREEVREQAEAESAAGAEVGLGVDVAAASRLRPPLYAAVPGPGVTPLHNYAATTGGSCGGGDGSGCVNGHAGWDVGSCRFSAGTFVLPEVSNRIIIISRSSTDDYKALQPLRDRSTLRHDCSQAVAGLMPPPPPPQSSSVLLPSQGVGAAAAGAAVGGVRQPPSPGCGPLQDEAPAGGSARVVPAMAAVPGDLGPFGKADCFGFLEASISGDGGMGLAKGVRFNGASDVMIGNEELLRTAGAAAAAAAAGEPASGGGGGGDGNPRFWDFASPSLPEHFSLRFSLPSLGLSDSLLNSTGSKEESCGDAAAAAAAASAAMERSGVIGSGGDHRLHMDGGRGGAWSGFMPAGSFAASAAGAAATEAQLGMCSASFGEEDVYDGTGLYDMMNRSPSIEPDDLLVSIGESATWAAQVVEPQLESGLSREHAHHHRHQLSQQQHLQEEEELGRPRVATDTAAAAASAPQQAAGGTIIIINSRRDGGGEANAAAASAQAFPSQGAVCRKRSREVDVAAEADAAWEHEQHGQVAVWPDDLDPPVAGTGRGGWQKLRPDFCSQSIQSTRVQIRLPAPRVFEE